MEIKRITPSTESNSISKKRRDEKNKKKENNVKNSEFRKIYEKLKKEAEEENER